MSTLSVIPRKPLEKLSLIWLQTFCIFSLLLFFSLTANGQSYFKDFLREEGLIFTKPKDFKLVIIDDDKEDIELKCLNAAGKKITESGDYYLINQDKSVIILIQEMGYKEMKGILHPYWLDDNRSFQLDAQKYANEKDNRIKYYSSNKLREINADGAAEFECACEGVSDASKYKDFKRINISKAFRSNYNFIYMFTDTSSKHQKDVMEKTWTMLKFSPDRQMKLNRNRLAADHYGNIELSQNMDSLTNIWNRGSVYGNLFYFNREAYAVRQGDLIISIQYPTNDKWPYFNKKSKQRNPVQGDGKAEYSELANDADSRKKWALANEDFKKYLALSAGTPRKLSKALLQEVSADDGYIFNFKHAEDDLYRTEYQDCIAVLLHKLDVGSIIIKYYFKGNEESARAAVETQWGFVRFQDNDYFESHKANIFAF
ncbi:hypothetical protein [Pedobacter deserti]|uniref:hypothetical protein n=1 Tax=Pedobacter deserti TaxID=2817382 RepID=UPI002108763F|nr:hypothetical protein [Pedobacter sp. SYSU D00382]